MILLSKRPDNNYVLTNVLNEDEGDLNLYNQVEQMALRRGSLFVPVKFSISKEEHIKCVTNPSRRERWKSIEQEEAHCKEELLAIKHQNLLELDVTNLLAAQAAEIILKHIDGVNSE